MMNNGIRRIVVMEHGQPLGIVTEADLFPPGRAVRMGDRRRLKSTTPTKRAGLSRLFC